MSQPKPPLKITGFSRGLNRYQLASYFTFLAQTFFFSYINIAHFYIPAQVIFSILYYIPTIGTILCVFAATAADPTDEIVIMERKCKAEGKHFDDTPYQYHCDYCNTCANGGSKHCGTCDRCVTDFDHHCHWINNCVSKKNYKAFFGAILCVGLATLIFALSGIFFMVDYYSRGIGIIENLSSLKHSQTSKWMPVVMAIFTFVAAVFCFLDLKLVHFHLYLIRNKMTTYDYILRERELKEEKEISEIGKRVKKSKKKERVKKVTPVSTPVSPLDLEAARIDDFNVRQEVQHTSNREGFSDRKSMQSDRSSSQRESGVLTPRREEDKRKPNYKDSDYNIEKYLQKENNKDLDRTISGKTSSEFNVEKSNNLSIKSGSNKHRKNKSKKHRLGDDLDLAGKAITIDPASYLISPSASLLKSSINSRNETPLSFVNQNAQTFYSDHGRSLKSPCTEILTPKMEEDPIAEKDNSAFASGHGTADRLRPEF